jgi:hypothetical protein
MPFKEGDIVEKMKGVDKHERGVVLKVFVDGKVKVGRWSKQASRNFRIATRACFGPGRRPAPRRNAPRRNAPRRNAPRVQDRRRRILSQMRDLMQQLEHLTLGQGEYSDGSSSADEENYSSDDA